ncbi:MAG: lysophospholipid acyltransferase family protein [Bacteroidota bacterium]
MKKILYVLYQPYKWLFFLFLIVNTLIFSLIAILISTLISQKVGAYCGTAWARFNSFFTPMIVDVSGMENMKKNTSYIIVPNHQSYYDIFVIYGWLSSQIRWVMKKELRKVPGFGLCCEIMGHIYIDRSSTQSAIESLKTVKQKLSNGSSVVIFPEGTRTTTGELGPFKKGAFRLAFDVGLPILPVTIIGTKDILPTQSFNLFPGKAKMIIHKPLDINTYTFEEMEKLMADVSEIIAAPLK